MKSTLWWNETRFVHLAHVVEHATERVYVVDLALQPRDLPHLLCVAEEGAEGAGERLLRTRQTDQSTVVLLRGVPSTESPCARSDRPNFSAKSPSTASGWMSCPSVGCI